MSQISDALEALDLNPGDGVTVRTDQGWFDIKRRAPMISVERIRGLLGTVAPDAPAEVLRRMLAVECDDEEQRL